MAKGDWKVIEKGGAWVQRWVVEDRTTSSLTVTIKPGEMVKQAADAANYVIPLLTGDPEAGTDIVCGIALTESTETSTVDGYVDVLMITPQTVLECKATTAANVDTQAEIDAFIGDCVAGDVTSLTQTIDEDEGNDNDVHGFLIVGGNPEHKTLYVRVKEMVLQEGVAL